MLAIYSSVIMLAIIYYNIRWVVLVNYVADCFLPVNMSHSSVQHMCILFTLKYGNRDCKNFTNALCYLYGNSVIKKN